MKKITFGTVVKRFFLSIFTVIGCLLITLISFCILFSHGPSTTVRDMLVLSAKQASATKWIPELFLPDETVDEIVKKSEEDTVVNVAIDKDEIKDEGEWDNCPDEGIRLDFVNKSSFKAYVMLVKDPSRVFVGCANDDFGKATEGKKIFDVVEKYDNIIAAINGGSFFDDGGSGTGAQPLSLTFSEGEVKWTGDRIGTFIGFDSDNKLIATEDINRDKMVALGIRDGVTFFKGSVLISNDGENININYKENNTGAAQRTAIGQRADGTVIMIATDGRTASSIGANYNDITDLMLEYGAVTAGMLDGGSSTMMYYRDYYKKYDVDTSSLDDLQLKGLVNKYKAFSKSRRLPTFFLVRGE